MEIVGLLYAQVHLWKWRNSYHFVKSSAYFVLKIELLLTELSNFERKAALKDLAFWWVECLNHKVWWSSNSLIINLIGLTCHMIWYIQYLGLNWGGTKWGNQWRTLWGLWEALGIGNCSINVWDGSKLKLSCSNKSSSYIENNLQYFYYLLFRIHLLLKSMIFYIEYIY